MGLNEEQNEQSQQTWLSRVARERQDLSASVAETLEVSIQEEFSWSNDVYDYTDGYPSAQDASVIPPRLSLQSRPIEVASSAHEPVADLNSSTVVPSGAVGGGDAGAPTQNSNILSRFAQRLTTSFSALNANLQGVDPVSMRQATQAPLVFDRKASSLASIADIEVCTTSTMTGPMTSAQQPDTPAVSTMGENAQATRQRLAGRTTRIRLEVVPAADAKKISQTRERDARSYNITEANTTGMRLPIAPSLRSEVGSTSVHLPAMKAGHDSGAYQSTADSTQDLAGSTGTHLPSPAPLTMEPKTMQGALSGTARFESGQRELTISNSAVTASSVVLVTLITNPGPVVVQYISLQPQDSFTVHLTSPASTSVVFNYVVLLGELF